MEYPATHIASSGHNSNPVTTTTTTTATAASEGEVEELDDKHDIGETFTPYSSQSNGRPHFADSDLLHPLRSSDASLSLHASQRLQSTPLGKQPPKAGLHRVYRTSASTTSPRPITSSVTDSSETGTLANSSVSLSSAEEDDHLAHSVSGRHNINSNNNSFGSRGPLAIRDYWNSLVLDLEGGNVRQPPQSQLPTSSSSQTLGRPAAVESGRVTHAPSTGSSTTLVEQEPASYKQITSSRLSHAHALAPRTTHSPSTVPAFATDHSTHTTSSPSNGDGIGMSRFAAAAAYVEQSYSEERSGSDNRSRSITPQQHSYSYTNEATREGDTEVASRVHDIFRRHIHNASTSYANRRTSSHTLHTSVRSDGNTITTAGQNPRHRLRDLLDRESHLQDESQNNAHATWRGSQASGRHGNANVDSVNSHQGHSSHSRSISRNVSRHGSATPIAGRSRRMSNTSVADDSASGISLKPRKSEERQQQLHEFSASTSISRLSREWRELSARATDRHLQDERSMGLPLDLATTDEEQDELMNDGDIEDHQPEGGSSVRRVTKANVSQSDERSSSRMASEARNRDLDIVQEDLESDDEDLLPSFVDLPSEEEISVEHTTQTPRSRQASRLLSQVSPSPLRTHGSASRSILGEATSHDTHSPTVIHASPSRSRQLFQSPSKPRTPPKTPHLPGHYLSNTPFVSVQPAAKSSLRGTDASRSHAESPDETFAIGTSNISMALPSLPGGYVSPFPHPRRQPTITQEEKVAVTGEQQRLVSPALRKTDRFSTMLQKVIEQREEEAQDTVAGPSTPSQSRFTGSPSRSTRHGIQRSHSPLSSSPLKPEAQPTTRSPIAKSGASPKKTLEGAESSIQAVLVDLARPLKNLLGTFGPTDLSEAASTSMEVHDPLRNAGDLEEDDRQARQVQRKTARVSSCNTNYMNRAGRLSLVFSCCVVSTGCDIEAIARRRPT